MKKLVKWNANEIERPILFLPEMKQNLGKVLEFREELNIRNGYWAAECGGHNYHKDWLESSYKRLKKDHYNLRAKCGQLEGKIEVTKQDNTFYYVVNGADNNYGLYHERLEDWVEGETWNGIDWVKKTLFQEGDPIRVKAGVKTGTESYYKPEERLNGKKLQYKLGIMKKWGWEDSWFEPWVDDEVWNGVSWVATSPSASETITPKEQAMTKLTFDESLPELGDYVLLIRNNIIYRKTKCEVIGYKKNYTMKQVFGESFFAPYVYEPADRLFQFPTELDLIRTMETRSCMDKFKVVPKKESATNKVIGLLKEGKVLGILSGGIKYRLLHNGSLYVQQLQEVGTSARCCGISDSMLQGANDTYVFNDDYGFWKWATQTP